MPHFKSIQGLGNLSPKMQRGVISLLVVLILLLIVRSVISHRTTHLSNEETVQFEKEWENYLAFQQKHPQDTASSTMKQGQVTASDIVLTPFDPNKVDFDRLLQLGVSSKTAGIWVRYLDKHGHFYKKEDLKKIYGLSSEEYNRLSPYVVFNEDKSQGTNDHPGARTEYQTRVALELNKATAEDLKKLPGIGSVLSERILKFRNNLGGFFEVEQLKDVYGVSDSTFDLVRNKITVDATLIKKMNINTAAYAELVRHPYLRPFVKDILKWRKSHDPIPDFNTLKNLNLINAEKYRKIAPYLTF